MNVGGNVRRLMYQPLIWPFDLGNDPSCLRTPLDAEGCQRLADALIYRMRRNMELGRDLLGAEMLIDEEEAIELGWTEAGDAAGHRIRRVRAAGLTTRVVRFARIIQSSNYPE